jgi:excisionase family DNA binding protein
VIGAGGVSDPYARGSEAANGAGSGAVGGLTVPRLSPYLLVEDVAARLRCSVRKIHELTRTRWIPHRRLPGSRRCLFLEAELKAWEAGAELETVERERGGRIVRPKGRER